MTTAKSPPTAGKARPGLDPYDAIVERLAILHPSIEPHEIRIIVQDAAHRFDGVRLGQFAPLLVEKIARDVCRERAKPEPPDLERAARSAAVSEIHD